MRASAVRVDADALDLIAEATAAACGIDRRHRNFYWHDGAVAAVKIAIVARVKRARGPRRAG
jgi:hypothetical protein